MKIGLFFAHWNIYRMLNLKHVAPSNTAYAPNWIKCVCMYVSLKRWNGYMYVRYATKEKRKCWLPDWDCVCAVTSGRKHWNMNFHSKKRFTCTAYNVYGSTLTQINVHTQHTVCCVSCWMLISKHVLLLSHWFRCDIIELVSVPFTIKILFDSVSFISRAKQVAKNLTALSFIVQLSKRSCGQKF